MPENYAERQVKLGILYSDLQGWGKKIGLLTETNLKLDTSALADTKNTDVSQTTDGSQADLVSEINTGYQDLDSKASQKTSDDDSIAPATIPEADRILSDFGRDKETIVSTLYEIEALLEAFINLKGKYPHLNPTADEKNKKAQEQATGVPNYIEKLQALPSDNTIYVRESKWKRLKSFIAKGSSGTWRLAKHPGNIVWTLMDEDLFDDMLEMLEFFIKYLDRAATAYETQQMMKIMTDNRMRLIQVSNSVEDLKSLFSNKNQDILSSVSDLTRSFTNVSSLLAIHGAHESSIGQAQKDLIREIVKMKLSKESRDSLTQLSRIYRKSSEEVTYVEESDQDIRAKGEYLKSHIWVEWKSYIPKMSKTDLEKTEPDPHTHIHTAELADLFHLSQSKEFCTPHCLGYFDDKDKSNRSRFGWIFKIPTGYLPNAPVSLLELYNNKRLPRPSLNARVTLAARLATSILLLHTANWIHKEFRSENVVIFQKDEGSFDLDRPVLGGFNFAREASGSTTSRPKRYPLRDIYRWIDDETEGSTPDFDTRHGRKTYDIYGLGLILVELAYWKALNDIVSFQNYQTAQVAVEKATSSSVTANAPKGVSKDAKSVTAVSQGRPGNVRHLLLNDKQYLSAIRVNMGETYCKVVETCLRGASAFGLDEDDDEKSVESSLKIYDLFNAEVALPLMSIHV
jgi:hypothetical protein